MHTFLFQYLPYIAGALFVCGVTYRIAAQGKTVQAYSTQFLSNDLLLKWGSNLFHVGIIMVFFGHIFGLLAPERPTTGSSPTSRSGNSPSSWAPAPDSSPLWASVC